MWQKERFPTLDRVLAFVNERRWRADQFKVVVARDEGGAPAFWVLYLAGEVALDDAVATAEAEPPAIGPTDEIVDAAEAIITDAQREE